MKLKNVVSTFGAGAILAVFITAPVIALESSEPTVVTDTKTTVTERLTQRRSELGTLSGVETARLKERCGAAQTKLIPFTEKVIENNQNYQTKYTAWIGRIQNSGSTLLSDGKDTAELEKQLTQLGQKYQIYKAQFDQLAETLSDLQSVDCKNDPAGFKGTLKDIRTQYMTMLDDRKDVTNYVRDTIVPTLKAAKGSE
jgi:predicted nuclease with TOPRIM domain